jgi:hypothetical protein
MIVDVTKPILDLDGNVLKDKEGELCIRKIIVNVLVNAVSEDPRKVMELVRKVRECPRVELSAEDASIIETLVCKSYIVLISSQIVDALRTA